jgi:hypothetical protein
VQPVAVLQPRSGQSVFEIQEGPRQDESQRHEEAQSTPLMQDPLSQATEQGPDPHWITFEQAFVPHVTEQTDDERQSIGLRHDPASQRTVQGPAPQVMGVGQAPEPVHVMSQLDARVQSTLLLQAFEPQVTRQGIPGGHTTMLVQLPDVEQSMTQVAPVQTPIVHAARQAVIDASETRPSGGTITSDDTDESPAAASKTRPPVPPRPPAPAPPMLASEVVPA